MGMVFQEGDAKVSRCLDDALLLTRQVHALFYADGPKEFWVLALSSREQYLNGGTIMHGHCVAHDKQGGNHEHEKVKLYDVHSVLVGRNGSRRATC